MSSEVRQYSFPTQILHGAGALEALAERLGAAPERRVLIVTDAGLRDAGLAARVEAALAAQGLAVHCFAGVHPNPVEADVTAGVAAYREGGCEAIVGLGGGSALDAAKVIQFMTCHDPPLAQYAELVGGDRRIIAPLPPLYAVPTTAGTGSEVGRAGVITVGDPGVKTVFFSPHLMPRVAVLDPRLTVGLPPHLTAATGMDALTHCLEAFLAPDVHPLCDGIALEGLRLLSRWLPRAVSQGEDLAARGHMQIAATMGATAFQKGLGMVHSLAHPLSARFGMHHGLANAVLLAPALGWLFAHVPAAQRDSLHGKYTRLGAALAADGAPPPAPEGLPDRIRALNRELGIAPGLRRHLPQLDAAALEPLSAEAFADGCHHGNAYPVTQAQLCEVYRAAL